MLKEVISQDSYHQAPLIVGHQWRMPEYHYIPIEFSAISPCLSIWPESHCETCQWMDDMQFYILSNSISVISELWLDDNERLWAMKLCL